MKIPEWDLNAIKNIYITTLLFSKLLEEIKQKCWSVWCQTWKKAQVAELQGGMEIRMEHMERKITAEGQSAQLAFIYIFLLLPVNDLSC